MYVVLTDLLFHQLKNTMGMNHLMIVSFKYHKHPQHLSSRKDCKSVANLCDLFGFFFYIKLEKTPYIHEYQIYFTRQKLKILQ